MDSQEFKKDFLESAKAAASVTGEGSCASFVENMAQYLIDTEVIPEFYPSFYKGQKGSHKYRVDGYVLDEFDYTMNLIVADYVGIEENRTLTNTSAKTMFKQLRYFIDIATNTDLYKEIEISTPCSDLVDMLRSTRDKVRKYRLFIFTDADMSSAIKTIDIEDCNGIPVEGQIWDIERLFRVCCSEQGRQVIEIDFTEYCESGIPCLEASSAVTDQYSSYLGVIPGKVLADIYDKYGSKLLEGNVRSFLSTKVAVNKKIRATILNSPEMFFAFNNGISATAMDVQIESTNQGKFIKFARDFQIINGGQTTASISNARYKDKALLDNIYVQMKLTAIDETTQEETDELIRNISRSSNSQNKVSDADFFASHPFHRRMEQISRHMFAPASSGAQYETKWFYERARGQYLQEQMRLTPAKKKQFELQHPKNKVIKKTDLAKVQNTWRGNPQTVSKGAQTNFTSFAEWINDEWEKNDTQFNERYFQATAALLLMFQLLEKQIPKQGWYEGGYRANVIYYTVALFHKLLKEQFQGMDLDLINIWNKQEVPEIVANILIDISEKVFYKITDPNRRVINVTQWCKRNECWEAVKNINYSLPRDIENYLMTLDEVKTAEKFAKKEQRITNDINAQVEVVKYSADDWKKISEFAVNNHLVSTADVVALSIACKIPSKIPNPVQSKKLLDLLERAIQEGFKI